MVMESSSDHHTGGVVLSSSIALLQERFRQLQKMKELRQGKELLKILSESSAESSCSPPPVSHGDPFSGPASKFVPPETQHCRLSLSLWSADLDSVRAGSRGAVIKGPPNAGRSSWFGDEQTAWLCTSSPSPIKVGVSGGSDVDTSLHL